MKLFWTLCIACNALFAFDYGLTPKRVGEGIYCFFGAPEAMNTTNNGNMVNTCFVDVGSNWMVIDSGPTYQYAQQATQQMMKIRKMPVATVINTHVHDDHWLGNNYYDEIGATVMGSEAFKEEAVSTPTRMQSRISPEAYEKTVPVLPNGYIEKERVIETPVGKVIIRSVGHTAHTDSDLYVYLPSKKALFAGDLIFNDRIPSIRDGEINGWITSLESIMTMDLEVIVGGHGYAYDTKAPEATLQYLKELKAGVATVLDEGGGIDDAVATVKMEAFKDYGMYGEMHKANVNAAFRMLEWADE